MAHRLLIIPVMSQSNKQDSFEQEALGHSTDLYAAALRYVRNERDAEDLVQETLARAYAAWDHYQRGTNCRAWLFRILTNNFINDYRKHVKEQRWILAGDPIISPNRRREARDPEGTLVEGTLSDEVVGALNELPSDFKQVVILADLQGKTYREIAKALSCPIGTVMSRLYRARRMLEEVLEDYAREQGIVRPVAKAA
jgi:RNA polymerase sigma-70 factor (ECF subfamily)